MKNCTVILGPVSYQDKLAGVVTIEHFICPYDLLSIN